jgi:hypothetical protein
MHCYDAGRNPNNDSLFHELSALHDPVDVYMVRSDQGGPLSMHERGSERNGIADPI